jgi:predicted extracellular nuclease
MSFRSLAPAFIVWLVSAAAPPPAAGQPTDLFFSEYIEGSSNNKALEIYNGTAAAIDLGAGGYTVQMFFNGSASAGLTISLTGTVAAGDVFVLAHASAVDEILGVADQTNGAGWYNGDDAVVLRRGTTVLDVIGQIGFDPGTEWGTGNTSTADNTLRRMLAIVTGDTNGADVFDPASEWSGFATNTFAGLGCHNAEPACAIPPAVLRTIAEIQGDGLATPFANTRVRTEHNVVTAVTFDGFFIQSPSGDGNPDTSDGIFVFTGGAPTVAIGNEVEVTGTVTEFFNMTEINASDVAVTAASVELPPPVLFDAATPSPTQPQSPIELERYEGMLVRVENGLISGPTNEFNEASIVATGARAFREPGILYPGLSGLPVWDGNPEIFEVDTDRYLASPRLPLAAGMRITVEGPLAFSFSDYQIWPSLLETTGTIALAPVRARRPGEFTVGSQNVLRLFDTINDPNDDEVMTAEEYERRLAKLSLHIRQAIGAPDVLALQEVEKLQVLEDLAARIEADDPAIVYTAYLLEGNDIGGIDVGFLVRDTIRVDAVEQFGKDDTFTFNGVTALLNDRPPLVLRGTYLGGGADFPITVVNVHQRSLSGIEGTTANAERVRAKRHEQAVRLSQYIDSIQDADPTLRLVVIGDFNAFEFSDGYVDVMGQVTGKPDPAGALIPATDEISLDLTNQTLLLPAAERYSFVFDGSAQSLDHALTSQGLDQWVRGTAHARGNADAPASFAALPTTPLRTSDHDATVVFITTDLDGDGVADHLDACAATRIPESLPLRELKPNHFALVDGDGIFDTAAGHSSASSFTIQDTRGCSCEQILARSGGVAMGQQAFGCSVDTMRNWVRQ